METWRDITVAWRDVTLQILTRRYKPWAWRYLAVTVTKALILIMIMIMSEKFLALKLKVPKIPFKTAFLKPNRTVNTHPKIDF